MFPPVTYGLQQSTSLAEKAKEFLQFGKVVHSRTPSYNSAIQNLLYSKYVPDGHAANIFHSAKGAVDQNNFNRSFDTASTAGEKSISSNSQKKYSITDPIDPNRSILSCSSTSKVTDDDRMDSTINSTSSLFSELRQPMTPPSVQDVARFPSSQLKDYGKKSSASFLQNLSFCQYPQGSSNAAEAVSVPVPLVDVQYDSSDEEDIHHVNGQDTIHKKQIIDSRPIVKSGLSFMSKKPNLIGSIKIEEYFIQTFRDEINGERKVCSDSIIDDNRSSFGMSEMSGVPSFMSAVDTREKGLNIANSNEMTSLSTSSRPIAGVYRYTSEANSSMHDIHNNDNDLVYSLSVVSSLDHDDEPDDSVVASPLSDVSSPHFKSFIDKDNRSKT